MEITFYGAAGEVTGSNFLVTTRQSRFVVDCGMFQGRRMAEEQNYHPLPYSASQLDFMLLTHAHLDHCGRIPKLYKDGFRGKIYTTPATRELARLIMLDAAGIMRFESEKDEHDPLYTEADAEEVMRLFVDVEYNESTKVAPDVKAEFFDAGHILGSASIRIESEGKSVVFSGDLGNYPVPIVRRSQAPPSADLVIMESTYGGRLHEAPTDRRMKLRKVITDSVAKRGTLLIPAFALERTQEILYEIRGLVEDQSIPPIPIFLDSPLAIEITDVYMDYTRYFNEEALALIKTRDDLFNFPTLKVTESAEKSKGINKVEGPKVIIAGSGMMEGGRIIHHAKHYLPDETTSLVMVGYQAMGTLGRALFEGNRRVKIGDGMVTVRAHVAAIGAYSAHADQEGLEEWLSRFGRKPSKIALVHGEESQASLLASKLNEEYIVSIPKMNEKMVV